MSSTIAQAEDSAADLLESLPCGVLSVALDGTVRWANRRFFSMVGLSTAALARGVRFQELLTSASRILLQTQVQPLILSLGEMGEVALRFQRLDDSPLPTLINFQVRPGPDSQPESLLLCIFPTAQSARSEHEARRAEIRSQQLGAVVTACSDAIMSLGLDLEIRTWNAGAERLFGYTESEAVGQRADLLFVPEHKRAEVRRGHAELMAGRSPSAVESTRTHKDGHLIDVEISAAPMFDKDGRVTGFAAVLRDITERRRAVEALRTSHRALQAALDVANMASWGWDELEQVKTWSKEALAIFGLPSDTVMTRELFLSLVDTESVAPYEAAWATAMDPSGPRTYKLDYQIHRANDGAKRLISSKAVVEFDADKPVRVVGALRDITEERAAQDHIVLLLDEMNHRAKNLLQIVQVVVQQTAKHSDPSSFVERLSRRLEALSINQDLLVRNVWKGADLHDLVRSQLSPFMDTLDDRFVVEGPSARLSPQAAQAIGMALHELGTNASKYGALSTHSGRVRISWEIEYSAVSTFRLVWLEHDGPSVLTPTRKGFGHIVLGRFVGAAVSGQACVDYAADGLKWQLEAPLQNLMEGDRQTAAVRLR